jgi:5'/3'-nucleotidase
MRILLSNDDGIFAPGLMAMYRALADNADVDVVAPEAVQSGGSHSITIRRPVMWRRVHVAEVFHGTSVDGTPADCVKLAVGALLPQRPDLVVSGINAGLNTGIHAIYSGTVAAAVEGAIQGLPAIAVSLKLYRDMDFAAAAKIARSIIDQIVAKGLSPGQVCNINIPEIKPGWPRGIHVVPQSIQIPEDRIEKRTDPNGGEYYWLAGDFGEIDDKMETDLHAVREGYVTITPIQFNLTDIPLLAQMQSWTFSDAW